MQTDTEFLERLAEDAVTALPAMPEEVEEAWLWWQNSGNAAPGAEDVTEWLDANGATAPESASEAEQDLYNSALWAAMESRFWICPECDGAGWVEVRTLGGRDLGGQDCNACLCQGVGK